MSFQDNKEHAKKLIAAGNHLLCINRLDQALEKFKEAIHVAPDHDIAYLSAANCYLAIGQYKEAMLLAQRALSIQPQNSFSYYVMGVCYMQSGHLDKSLELFKNATSIHSYLPLYWSGIGKVYLYKKDYQKAIESLNHALQLDPNYGYALHLLALTYQAANSSEEALNFIDRAIEVEPNNSEYHLTAGVIKGTYGVKEKSELHFKTAIATDPTNPKKRDTFLTHYIAKGFLWGGLFQKSVLKGYMHFTAYWIIVVLVLIGSVVLEAAKFHSPQLGFIIKMLFLSGIPIVGGYLVLPTLVKLWKSFREWGWHGIGFSLTDLHVLLILIIWGFVFTGITQQNCQFPFLGLILSFVGIGLAYTPKKKKKTVLAKIILVVLLVNPTALIYMLTHHNNSFADGLFSFTLFLGILTYFFWVGENTPN